MLQITRANCFLTDTLATAQIDTIFFSGKDYFFHFITFFLILFTFP